MSRDIKGPEDCEPLSMQMDDEGFTAQEVGQIISLAMDAEQKTCEAEWRDIPDYRPVNEFRRLSEAATEEKP